MLESCNLPKKKKKNWEFIFWDKEGLDLRGKKKKQITLKNDRYMDVQNINKKIYEIGFIIYSDLKI